MLQIRDFKKNKPLDYTTRIWMAIMKMEDALLIDLLNDNIDYEDVGKFRFIDKLYKQFQMHKTLGDTELLLDLDFCEGCNCDQPICRFSANKSGKHFF